MAHEMDDRTADMYAEKIETAVMLACAAIADGHGPEVLMALALDCFHIGADMVRIETEARRTAHADINDEWMSL